MSVIELKPHLLSFLSSVDGYEDDNGDWHKGTEEWSEPVSCHAVAAGQASQIPFEDGTTLTYTYTIGRLPADFPELSVGTKVRLAIGSSEREYSVKGFHRYQLQAKVWV